MLSSLFMAIWQYVLLRSQPIHLRPKRSAATSVVPSPQKQSKMIWSGVVKAEIRKWAKIAKEAGLKVE